MRTPRGKTPRREPWAVTETRSEEIEGNPRRDTLRFLLDFSLFLFRFFGHDHGVQQEGSLVVYLAILFRCHGLQRQKSGGISLDDAEIERDSDRRIESQTDSPTTGG